MTSNSLKSTHSVDTIVAQATAPGRAGVGVIRLSGPASLRIAETLLGFTPQPRHAHYAPISSQDGTLIDEGITLSFPKPNSFTGEDVIEFQCHGGPILIDLLIKETLRLGARLARPGEFSERAFLNDKIDLAQAEAIADLINASSEQAARSALRSLQGDFSSEIEQLASQIVNLRVYVEAAIDFPDEEIDFLSDGHVDIQLVSLIEQLERVNRAAHQGSLLREGMTVVIAGRPNAGKSSLLNALTGRESAIVTNVEGTTRDLLREQIHIDGMPLHVIDTAGLRESSDTVEQIGIERAWEEIKRADALLVLTDATRGPIEGPLQILPELKDHLEDLSHVTLVKNKIDLINEQPSKIIKETHTLISVSAKQKLGIDLLTDHLKSIMGFNEGAEGSFLARRRHLEALDKANTLLRNGLEQLREQGAGELLAEDLRQAHQSLGEITGKMTADELLGSIFGSFCIGK